MNPEILYEDEQYIVFNKPAGLVVHGDGRSKEPTLADWLLKNRPDMSKVGEPLVVGEGTEKEQTILRPGIVHRLDKETSGAIVVAKTKAAFEDLKEKFQNREVGKKYHVFVYGNLTDEDGTINRPIGRSKSDFRKWSAQRGARGEMRDAITNYRVLAHGDIDGSKFDLVEAQPKTGRTHQIRVHFKAIHHPVVADSLYAPNQTPVLEGETGLGPNLGFKRLALHARELSFIPKSRAKNQKRIIIEAPYPEDFARAVEQVSKAQ
jgi:23S rRNA pseudouridine1911/1915/1917 synthase